MALQRAVRLRKNGDFQRVRQQGRSIASRLLILAWAPNDVAQLRVGFVISKRISKHAVTRNYIKRLLGEAIRLLLPQISGEWDIVVTAKIAIQQASLQVIISDLTVLLRKAQLLKS
ncbi:MAG TPA: ribonuclease P protein component [Ktedonobacteraceae bacterium]